VDLAEQDGASGPDGDARLVLRTQATRSWRRELTRGRPAMTAGSDDPALSLGSQAGQGPEKQTALQRSIEELTRTGRGGYGRLMGTV
jgi:hypothetical protein